MTRPNLQLANLYRSYATDSRTQSSKARHDRKSFSTANKVYELGGRELDDAANDAGQDAGGAGEGEQGESRRHIGAQIALNLLFHGHYKENKEDAEVHGSATVNRRAEYPGHSQAIRND